MNSISARSIIVIGANGQLGRAMVSFFAPIRTVEAFDRKRLDLTDLGAIPAALGKIDFDLLVNCSALTNVDTCEDAPEETRRINAEVPLLLARLCRERGAKCVHIGTDYVFDGKTDTPYTEESVPAPLSVYGRTKLEGEEGVLEIDPDALVLRTSRLFSVHRPGFPEWVISRAMETGDPIPVVGDKFANLTRADDVPVLLAQLLAIPGAAHGIYNFVNSGIASLADQARFVLERASVHHIPVQTTEVRNVEMATLPAFKAPRPQFSVLSNEKFIRVTGKRPASWKAALDAHIELIAPRYQVGVPQSTAVA